MTTPEVAPSKFCTSCETTKPLDDFPNNKGRKDGKGNYCDECNRARVRKWQQENPERQKANHAAWRHTPRGKERIWAYKLMERYGITPERYWQAWEEQEGACAVCREPFEELPHVDHDHVTLIFRGLLCRGCNHGLGNFQDGVDRLLSGALYLLERGAHVPSGAEGSDRRGFASDLRRLLSGAGLPESQLLDRVPRTAV